jgi:tetratricopeptide (TPR) repeat protein
MGAWLGGALLGAVPMPRPVRYRLRLHHPGAARASDAIADRMLPVLLVIVLLLFVIGIRPGMDSAFRLFWIGSALGVLSGVPFVVERRGLRRRLRALPPVADPLDELARALPDDPAVRALAEGDAAEALRLVRDMDRDDPSGLRAGAMACAVLRDQRAARALALRAVQLDPLRWEVAAQTGLALAQRGRFGEGVRLLERAAEVSKGHHRAELMLAHGTLLAGRLREAAEALDRSRGR